VTIAGIAAISATILFGEIWLRTTVWVSPSHHLHSQENSDKYRQEKEAIKVDFIRWVLIFKKK
jgi:hypothetical protein